MSEPVIDDWVNLQRGMIDDLLEDKQRELEIVRAFIARVRQRHSEIFETHPDPALRDREPHQVWDALLNEAILAELTVMEEALR